MLKHAILNVIHFNKRKRQAFGKKDLEHLVLRQELGLGDVMLVNTVGFPLSDGMHHAV